MGIFEVGENDRELPPFDDFSLPDKPFDDGVTWSGVMIGSALSQVCSWVADDSWLDVGELVSGNLAMVHPGLVEVARLGSVDFGTLDAAARIDALLAFGRQQAWLEARQQELLALMWQRDSSEANWCVEEVGSALRLSGAQARARLHNAEQLCARLPETLQALSEGQIAPAQATAITEASYELDDELLPAFEGRVLQHAPEQSLAQLRRTVRRAVLCLDARTAEQKRLRAVADRHVRMAPADHGLAWVMALLPAADAQAVYHRIDGAARLAPTDDVRTLDQLRADAFVDGVLNGIHGALPTAHGRQPNVNVIVGLSTLVGSDDEPGWLDGYGAIGAGYAREIAHDPTGTWRRLLTDPVSGQLLDYGTSRYRPPRHLAEHVLARDGECGFPFCSQPARRSDLDHIKPYPQGETSAANLQPLHRRHHKAKTAAGWQSCRDDRSGTTAWTSPQGRRYLSRPPERWSTPVPRSSASPEPGPPVYTTTNEPRQASAMTAQSASTGS